MPKKSSNKDIQLTDTQLEVMTCGHNFFGEGGEFGPPPAPFRDLNHMRKIWMSVKHQLLDLVKNESEVNKHGDWRFRGMYMPWGPKVESFAAYWMCETDETMPWPRPPTLSEMKGKNQDKT